MTTLSLTLFTTMKPFRDENARIQQNAVKSWLALEPTPEVLVLGDDFGVAEACCDFGVRHVPEVETAPSGAPVLDDLFARAEHFGTGHVLCYVNADIVLTSDFVWAVESVFGRLGGAILICTPWNLGMREELDTSDGSWERTMRVRARREGSAPGKNGGADVFAFPRGAYRRLPRMVMGRSRAWDNVLMWHACTGQLPAVDITDAVLAIHQAHPGSSHAGNVGAEHHYGSEVELNRAAAAWWRQLCWRVDLPMELRADGSLVRRRRMARAMLLGAVTWRQGVGTWYRMLTKTIHVRRRLGLYRWWRAGHGGSW